MATRTAFPARVSARMTSALKRFQPILTSALARDVNESDTVSIVTDLLADVFGYDKYHEVTSEHQIRGTFCDLAVEIEGQLRLLLEVKAIGLDLKEKHLRQAVNYASNQGIDWIILTNGIAWQVYKVDFAKPIKEDLVLEFNLLEVNPRNTEELERLYLVTREGVMKSALPGFYTRKQATNRFIIGAIALSDPVLSIMRRELKRLAPDIKVTTDQIRDVLLYEVLKREVAQGEKAEEAMKKVQKSMGKQTRGRKPPSPEEESESEGEAPIIQPPPD